MSDSYRVRALAGDGRRTQVEISAASREAAAAAVLERGLLPIRVSRRSMGPIGRGQPRGESLAIGLQALGDLLLGGLPLLQALDVLAEHPPERWATALPPVRRSVATGQTLSKALAAALDDLPDPAMGLIQASEQEGRLGRGVAEAATLVRERVEGRRALLDAIAYPVLLAFTSLVVLCLVVAVVLPRLATIFEDMGASPPWVVGVLLDVRAVMVWFAKPFGIFTALAIVTTAVVVARQVHTSRWVAGAILRVPVVGEALELGAVSRAARVTGRLLGGGVRAPEALLAGARAAGSPVVEERLVRAGGLLHQGIQLVDALRQTSSFPPRAIALLSAAARESELAMQMTRVAELEGERARRGISRALRALEPALVLTLAVGIGLMASALLRAMYSMAPQ